MFTSHSSSRRLAAARVGIGFGLRDLVLLAVVSGNVLAGCEADAGETATLGRGDVTQEGNPQDGLTSELSTVAPGVVRHTLRNVGTHAVAIAAWEVSSDNQLVSVTENGVPVSFRGPVVQRMAIPGAPPLELSPGAEYTHDIDVADNFAVTAGKRYDVSPLVPSKVSAGSVVDMSGPVVLEIPERTIEKGTGRGSTTTCTGTNATGASDAQAGAHWMLNHHVTNFPNYRARRDRWFGTLPVSTDWDFFLWQSHLTTIGNSISIMWTLADSNPPPSVSCDPWGGTCKKTASSVTLAWTLWGNARVVHLCPAFFDLPHDSGEASKGKSRVGTIIHEYAHEGGMTDIYGYEAASNLAARDPLGAANNADNYVYYIMGGP